MTDANAKAAEPQLQTAKCTLCAGTEPCSGFYHGPLGCMILDGECPDSEWDCDGKGNLTRKTQCP